MCGQVIDALERMIEILTPEGAWCQDELFIDDPQGRYEVDGRRIASACLVGATVIAVNGNALIEDAVYDYIGKRINGRDQILKWNDDASRTQEDVLLMLKQTVVEVEAERDRMVARAG